MRTGTVTWQEINGVGTLVIRWDDGEDRETIEHDQPINAETDSEDTTSRRLNLVDD